MTWPILHPRPGTLNLVSPFLDHFLAAGGHDLARAGPERQRTSDSGTPNLDDHERTHVRHPLDTELHNFAPGCSIASALTD